MHKYDFLKDAAAVKLVNAISVAKDHASSLKIKNTFIARFCNLATGSIDEHQHDFNIEVSDALALLKNEVNTTNKAVIQNSEAIAKVTQCLLDMREVVNLHSGEIKQLQERLASTELRLDLLEAKQVVDQVIERWKATHDQEESLFVGSLRLLQMLYWSRFSSVSEIDKETYQYGLDKSLNTLLEAYSIEKSTLINQYDLAYQTKSLSLESKDAIELMLPYFNTSNLCVGLMDNQLDFLLSESRLSRVTTPQKLVGDLFSNSFHYKETV